METLQQPSASLFAQMVDKLREKTDEELKMLYIKFFQNDLSEEWKNITNDIEIGKATDEDISKAIERNRYKS